MSDMWATNPRTKKRYRKHKRKAHRRRETSALGDRPAYTKPKEKEKLGSGYFSNKSVI